MRLAEGRKEVIAEAQFGHRESHHTRQEIRSVQIRDGQEQFEHVGWSQHNKPKRLAPPSPFPSTISGLSDSNSDAMEALLLMLGQHRADSALTH